MDIPHLKDCLDKGEREELGIPVVNQTIANSLQAITQWAAEGRPEQGRQLWFCIGNAAEVRNSLHPYARCRILPLTYEQTEAVFRRGPIDALLLPKHGWHYSDPNLSLPAYWRPRGSYVQCNTYKDEQFQLWFWISNRPKRRLFGLDHHHAVIWDAKQILRPLNIYVDFFWICDGRPPINEAIPTLDLPVKTSLDLYVPPPEQSLSPDLFQRIHQGKYDGIVTAFSLITAFRLREAGLPIYHMNATRFGNNWICKPDRHDALIKGLAALFQENRLHVIHNNRGDQAYFRQFFKLLEPHQDICIPSLCESSWRTRLSSVKPFKVLLWDTRCVLLQPNKSPFMKSLYIRLRQKYEDAIDSQALLMTQEKGGIPEGYLDKYTTVIHIPYNCSTMSIFQQTRANIPVWVPSQRLLAELWADPQENNELSWTEFASEDEKKARTSWMDHVREPSVAKRWAELADFYYTDTMSNILTFDSVEDILNRIESTDYDSMIRESEAKQEEKRNEILFAWEQVFQGLVSKSI